MKKTYQKPELEIVAAEMVEMVAATVETEIESVRNVGGGPTEDDGLTLPTVVGETDGMVDPYGGHGQGGGGGGNRAKGGLWDGWDD